MDKTTLLSILIGIGIPALASIAAGLAAKFIPRQKCADWLWGGMYPLIVALDKVLDLRVGNKTAQVIMETTLGTIGYVMQVIGTRLLNWLRVNNEAVK